MEKKNWWWGGWTGGEGGGSAAKQPPYTSGAVVCEYANIVREVAPAREASAGGGATRARRAAAL